MIINDQSDKISILQDEIIILRNKSSEKSFWLETDRSIKKIYILIVKAIIVQSQYR